MRSTTSHRATGFAALAAAFALTLTACGSDDVGSAQDVDRSDPESVATAFMELVVARDCAFIDLYAPDGGMGMEEPDKGQCEQSPDLYIEDHFTIYDNCVPDSFIFEGMSDTSGEEARAEFTTGGEEAEVGDCDAASGNAAVNLDLVDGEWGVGGWDTSRP